MFPSEPFDTLGSSDIVVFSEKSTRNYWRMDLISLPTHNGVIALLSMTTITLAIFRASPNRRVALYRFVFSQKILIDSEPEVPLTLLSMCPMEVRSIEGPNKLVRQRLDWSGYLLEQSSRASQRVKAGPVSIHPSLIVFEIEKVTSGTESDISGE